MVCLLGWGIVRWADPAMHPSQSVAPDGDPPLASPTAGAHGRQLGSWSKISRREEVPLCASVRRSPSSTRRWTTSSRLRRRSPTRNSSQPSRPSSSSSPHPSQTPATRPARLIADARRQWPRRWPRWRADSRRRRPPSAPSAPRTGAAEGRDQAPPREVRRGQGEPEPKQGLEGPQARCSSAASLAVGGVVVSKLQGQVARPTTGTRPTCPRPAAGSTSPTTATSTRHAPGRTGRRLRAIAPTTRGQAGRRRRAADDPGGRARRGDRRRRRGAAPGHHARRPRRRGRLDPTESRSTKS